MAGALDLSEVHGKTRSMLCMNHLYVSRHVMASHQFVVWMSALM